MSDPISLDEIRKAIAVTGGTDANAARDRAHHAMFIRAAAPVLLEIAAAALALGPELVYLIGARSERLRDALAKVRP